MTEYRGLHGKGTIEVWEDFTGFDADKTWAAGGFNIGKVHIASVNEGSIENTIDETGGVVALTNDTGDNDNFCMYAAPITPSAGGGVLEARLKVDGVTDLAIYVGFMETLVVATPVMPAEFATATMTYNGSGGMVGLQFDSDGTTDAWRAVMGDGGAAISDSSNGIAATTGNNGRTAPVADDWDVVTVELRQDGSASVYLNGGIVKHFNTGTLLTPTDLFFPVVIVENRAADAAVTEVDYFYFRGYRDWDDQ